MVKGCLFGDIWAFRVGRGRRVEEREEDALPVRVEARDGLDVFLGGSLVGNLPDLDGAVLQQVFY